MIKYLYYNMLYVKHLLSFLGMAKAHINNCDFTYGQFLNILFIRKKIFFCVWQKLFHQSSHKYLTYSYLTIFHKVVMKRLTCTILSIFQFYQIHSFVEHADPLGILQALVDGTKLPFKENLLPSRGYTCLLSIGPSIVVI